MDQYTPQDAPRRPQGNSEVNIFDDTPPPQVYYSQRAIVTFSILFSAIFGMVLLAMNLNKTEKGKKGIPWVITFGIAYTTLSLILMDQVPRANELSFLFGAIGGFVLSYLFWDKYIGKGVLYTKRSVAVPTIIGIVIALALVALIIVAGANGW